jgi:hypothetical protein
MAWKWGGGGEFLFDATRVTAQNVEVMNIHKLAVFCNRPQMLSGKSFFLFFCHLIRSSNCVKFVEYENYITYFKSYSKVGVWESDGVINCAESTGKCIVLRFYFYAA